MDLRTLDLMLQVAESGDPDVLPWLGDALYEAGYPHFREVVKFQRVPGARWRRPQDLRKRLRRMRRWLESCRNNTEVKS